MEDNKKLEQIYAALLDGFYKAKQKNPKLDVDTYIMEYLSKNGENAIKTKVKESLDFISDLDRNTAKVMEETKRMRLGDWIQKNVIDQVENPEAREEVEKGLNAASEKIVKQSITEEDK